MRVILAEANLSTQAFYRYFASKDELMLALLDEGRGDWLLSSLQRRMLRSAVPAEQVRAWVEGVLGPGGERRSSVADPALGDERAATCGIVPGAGGSVDLLLGLLRNPFATSRARSEEERRQADDRTSPSGAVMVYRLAFATLRAHLAAGTKPGPGETEDLVAFCIGSDGVNSRRREGGP